MFDGAAEVLPWYESYTKRADCVADSDVSLMTDYEYDCVEVES